MTHSFVIPVFGKSPFLRECILSLQRQSVPSQILLTSANETEFLKNLAKEFDLNYLINPEGNQIGKDWNFALNKADTDLVTIAHQDDIYLNNYTENILREFEKKPKAAIAFTDNREIRDNQVAPENINLKIKHLLLTPERYFPSRVSQDIALRFGCSICCPSVTFNKNVLEDFEFDETLKSNLDWLAWTKMHKDGERFIYIPEILMLHRVHAQSETSKQIKDNKRQKEDLIVFKEFWPAPLANMIGKIYKLSEKSN